jgi:hypothetical protein
MAPSGFPHGGRSAAWRRVAGRSACQHPDVLIRRPLMARSPLVRSVGLAAALLLAAGCSSQTETDDAAATGGITSSSAAAEDSTASSTPVVDDDASLPGDAAASPFPADTNADVADPDTPQDLTVTAVRAARHDGYDRVVFELTGSGAPGWTVEYVDAASAQGSGAPVDVPGQAVLQVTLQGTSYPYETGADEVAGGAVPVSGTQEVAGVVYDGTFEGTSVAWIGTAARTPFRVYSLTSPSRVVVEVADAG